MINTHYFLRPPELDADTFAQLVIDLKDILFVAKKAVPLCGFDGTGAPEITGERIAFNGCQAEGGDHEPLVIDRIFTGRRNRNGECFAYCKTHGRPYDLAVVASLYALIHRFTTATFTSDSTPDELRAGFELFKTVVNPKASESDLFERPGQDKREREIKDVRYGVASAGGGFDVSLVDANDGTGRLMAQAVEHHTDQIFRALVHDGDELKAWQTLHDSVAQHLRSRRM